MENPRTGSAVIEPPRMMIVSDIDERGIHVLIWGRIRATNRFDTEGEYRRLLLLTIASTGIEPVVFQRVDMRDGRAHEPGEGPSGSSMR